MSPTMMNTHMSSSLYTTSPTDALDRHEYGVQKNRKPASTGGGRAWSEDEEVYLLQTRLQKMPYKHIAAHLKKTELACRLHYHQLSHGSNRRKRTASVSSSSSIRSPLMNNASMPSPIHEVAVLSTPPSYNSSPVSPPHMQLPLPSASTLLSRTPSISPQRILPNPSQNGNQHPIAILPKPSPQRSHHTHTPTSATGPNLRLNCTIAGSQLTANDIDKDRLRRIYESHRGAFWYSIAAEYGDQVSPLLLEEVWRRGAWNAPPTPCVSPDGSQCARREESEIQGRERANSASGREKASISALLGIDASPRSPKERELIKRLEEGARMEMV